MKDEILRLWNEGKNYTEIQNLLGCSKGTISYHCGPGQKEKVKVRAKANRKNLTRILKQKKDSFSIIRNDRKTSDKRVSLKFSFKEFISKLESNPICYLSGRSIDLTQPKTYQCDHIVPVSKGGDASIENLGLVCKDANSSKSYMLLEDYLSLCKEVLIHNGYKVEKYE